MLLQKWSQGTHIYHKFLFLWFQGWSSLSLGILKIQWMRFVSAWGHKKKHFNWIDCSLQTGEFGCLPFNQHWWAVWQNSMVILTFHRHSLSCSRQKEINIDQTLNSWNPQVDKKWICKHLNVLNWTERLNILKTYAWWSQTVGISRNLRHHLV